VAVFVIEFQGRAKMIAMVVVDAVIGFVLFSFVLPYLPLGLVCLFGLPCLFTLPPPDMMLALGSE
jgi:hypothetical protein